MKKALLILVGMALASILLLSGYWAYFNIRYKVVTVNKVPVLYDTWTNEWSQIKMKKEAGVIEVQKTEAPAPVSPAPTTVPRPLGAAGK